MEEEKPVLHGVNIRAATPDRLIHLCVESFGKYTCTAYDYLDLFICRLYVVFQTSALEWVQYCNYRLLYFSLNDFFNDISVLKVLGLEITPF